MGYFFLEAIRKETAVNDLFTDVGRLSCLLVCRRRGELLNQSVGRFQCFRILLSTFLEWLSLSDCCVPLLLVLINSCSPTGENCGDGAKEAHCFLL